MICAFVSLGSRGIKYTFVVLSALVPASWGVRLRAGRLSGKTSLYYHATF